jgi:hypothetical protein
MKAQKFFKQMKYIIVCPKNIEYFYFLAMKHIIGR